MAEAPIRVTFLLVSGFMMAAYVLATDALRLANWRDGRRLFRWDTRTPDDAPAEANNGMTIAPDSALLAKPLPDAVFVAAGYSPEHGCTARLFTWLRGLDRQGRVLGGWDTGPLVLAEAGLMDGYAMALHWQAAPAVDGRYPRVEIVTDSCQVAARRYTSPGGLSTFDLLASFIEQTAGKPVSQMVIRSANRNAVGSHPGGQPFSLPLGRQATTKLARIIASMEESLDAPRPIPAIAQQHGLSERSLYRLFRNQLGTSPRKFYLALRLHCARDLLRQSDMPILEIAAATGFNSSSRFSQAFRSFFGRSPSEARKQPRWLQIHQAAPKAAQMIRTVP